MLLGNEYALVYSWASSVFRVSNGYLSSPNQAMAPTGQLVIEVMGVPCWGKEFLGALVYNDGAFGW
ncbi:hypothetical protein FRX31_012038 [Thalictrum thalictroides]|uniref:Uncharacterized protein n=1 Tax=Thalictrum thalictroides TaxID=46969 RepID=A0A7J6WN70_THATH|nr:hypothetical protein FRX31_012038 [Thalictrum thalictroides]